jgi:hypothetical protein
MHFDFAHDRIREAVYEGIAPEARAVLHARVAHGMAGDAGLSACLMARHFHQAGERGDAYRYALAGAEWARGVFAYGGELEMLDLAHANAPDDKAEQSIGERLRALRGTLAVSGPKEESQKSEVRPMRRWWGAAAVVATLSIAGWLTYGSGVAGLNGATLPPLPNGLLVSIREGDATRYAVVDPDDPGRRPDELAAREFSVAPTVDPGSLILSRDLSLAAFTITQDAPPDVWVQRRDGSGLRRLTTDPEDDVVADWLPDGSGVLVRTMRGRSGDDYGYGLAIVPFQGAPVRMITNGPWSDRAASLSPDGGKIAVVRELGGASLWLMGLDGSGAHPVMEGLGEAPGLTWAPDGGRLALVESAEGGMRLCIVDPYEESPTLSIVADRVVGGPVWSADSKTIYYTAWADENLEVFAVSATGGEPVRVTHSPVDERLVALLGPPTPYTDAVEIVRGPGAHEIGLLVGDSAAVTAVAWGSEGHPSEAGPELRCVNSQRCLVTEEGYLRGLSPGETQLIADVGGWRADTLAVRVLDGTPHLVLSEDWEAGIDRSEWRSFGSPSPLVKEGVGRGWSRGFIANGDAKFGSGVAFATPIPWQEGLTVEWWARGEFKAEWPSFQGWSVVLAEAPPLETGSDTPVRSIETVAVGNGSPDHGPQLEFGGYKLKPSAEWDPAEGHQYAFQLLPDTRCELWIDGVRRFQAQCRRPPTDQVWLVLSGRATNGPVVHDDVAAWTGVRWR